MSYTAVGTEMITIRASEEIQTSALKSEHTFLLIQSMDVWISHLRKKAGRADFKSSALKLSGGPNAKKHHGSDCTQKHF